MTYLWRESVDETFYRIQTDSREIAKQLKKEKIKLIGTGMNCPLWLFRLSRKSIQSLFLIIKGVSGVESVKFNADEDLYEVMTHSSSGGVK